MPRSCRLLVSLLSLAIALSVPARAQAQSAEHDAAYAVVTRLFDAMRARDTAAMRASFAEAATLQSLSAQGAQTIPITNWLAGVAGAPAGVVLDERLANPIVQVSGPLATVWVDYWLFRNEVFSHCGVDAFVLAKTDNTWRILSVADTRQREGCPAAP